MIQTRVRSMGTLQACQTSWFRSGFILNMMVVAEGRGYRSLVHEIVSVQKFGGTFYSSYLSISFFGLLCVGLTAVITTDEKTMLSFLLLP